MTFRCLKSYSIVALMILWGKINGFVGISPIPVPANMKCNQNLIFPSPFCNTIVVSSRFNHIKEKNAKIIYSFIRLLIDDSPSRGQ